MAATSAQDFLAGFRDTIDSLYSSSHGATWNVSRSSFAAGLQKSFESRFGADAVRIEHAEAVRFLNALHAADLALAIACREGNPDAWRHLIATYRSPIDAFARMAFPNSTRAGEIADSLWAELYGLRRADAERRSPLDYYGGRSSLMSWLRVVVTRLEADQWRATRHTEPLNDTPAHNGVGDNGTSSLDPDRPRLMSALDQSMRSALAELSPEDRLRLSYYYVQDLTLAQTAALLGEHESSTSRNLARARTAIRDRVTLKLRHDFQLSQDQIDQCFEYATDDWSFDLGRALALGK